MSNASLLYWAFGISGRPSYPSMEYAGFQELMSTVEVYGRGMLLGRFLSILVGLFVCVARTNAI